MPRRSRHALTQDILRRLDSIVAAHIAMQAMSPSEEDVPVSQLKALYVIRHHGRIRVGQLGTLLGLSPNGITLLVDALEEAGRVTRERDPEDRRAVLVGLTDDGAQWLARLHSSSMRGVQALAERLTLDELRALDAGTLGLLRVFQEGAAARGLAAEPTTRP